MVLYVTDYVIRFSTTKYNSSKATIFKEICNTALNELLS